MTDTRRRPPADRRTADETRRVRDLYDRRAARYESLIGVSDRLLLGGHRAWATSQAVGDVLEVAMGTGRNLPLYRPGVRLTGGDISLSMLKIARARARALRRSARLHVADAQRLPFAAGQFDTVLSTLSLCTIPDERRALAEAWRVLRPGGQLILVEHVRSPQRAMRALQRILEPVFSRCAGDHLLRDPLDHLADLGFVVEFCDRSRAGVVERVIARKDG
jgi:ubiquinone/menaquinone biosynthesis C-methylase UbiE